MESNKLNRVDVFNNVSHDDELVDDDFLNTLLNIHYDKLLLFIKSLNEVRKNNTSLIKEDNIHKCQIDKEKKIIYFNIDNINSEIILPLLEEYLKCNIPVNMMYKIIYNAGECIKIEFKDIKTKNLKF